MRTVAPTSASVSASETVAVGMTSKGGSFSVKPHEMRVPESAPLRSTTGASLTGRRLMLALDRLLLADSPLPGAATSNTSI